MNKIVFFLIIVILGSVGALTFINSNQANSKKLFDAFPSPSLAVIKPSQQPPLEPTPTATPEATVLSPDITATKAAILKTSKGDIELVLYGPDASKTVTNFITKAKSGFYKNLTFHRVEDWVVQGGDPLGNGTGGGNMPVEFNNHPFVVGSLGVASRGDGQVQNDAQFFITKRDAAWLNGQYTNFGIVTKGMDIVEKLAIGDKILGITIE